MKYQITKKSIFDIFDSIVKHFKINVKELYCIKSIELLCNGHDLGTECHAIIEMTINNKKLILEDIVEFNRKFPWHKNFYIKILDENESKFVMEEKIEVKNIYQVWKKYIYSVVKNVK
jgi:hypothetical protein